nr:hypothetical protein [uncultured Desulfobacter sp.]
MEQQIKEIEQQVARFDKYQEDLKSEPDWQKTLDDLGRQFSQVDAEYNHYDEKKDLMIRQSVIGDGQIKSKKTRLEELILNMEEVKPLLGFAGETMTIGNQALIDESLDFSSLVNKYVQSRKQALVIKDKIYSLFDLVEANDGLRFVYGDTIPERIKSLCNQTDTKSMEQYKTQAKNIENTHSCIIGASLKSLTGKLDEFSTAIRAFNRSMNKNSISNLKEIKFSIEENISVLRKIRALIDSEPGTLFDNNSNQKFKQLIESMQSGTVLNLPNLFNLYISIELKNGKQVSFYGKSKIESNGTDLTIKAVVNIMILKKIIRQRSDQVLNIPIYIDEAGQIDSINQKTLISECEAAGFVPVFASVDPQETAYYWIGLDTVGNDVYITPDDWFTLERIEKEEAMI